jgi:hypothetical protein
VELHNLEEQQRDLEEDFTRANNLPTFQRDFVAETHMQGRRQEMRAIIEAKRRELQGLLLEQQQNGNK